MMQKIKGSFFPEPYLVAQMYITDVNYYAFDLISKSALSTCPICATESERFHSYQERTVKDLPIFGKCVILLIAQKRYYCDNTDCRVDIFTEQNDFVNPYYHFTERCRDYMLKVATMVSCEAASKILAYQGIDVSGDTLLRVLKAAGESYEPKICRKIGVDDWAYRKGQEYGTIICDLETREVIDVLEGRDKETFKKWLRGHPEIELVSRDRASAYANAVNDALPEAIQIADRFHITKNLLDALKDTMKAFMPEILEVPNNQVAEPEEVRFAVKKTRKQLSGRLPK